jgi:hypothetical protein
VADATVEEDSNGEEEIALKRGNRLSGCLREARDDFDFDDR